LKDKAKKVIVRVFKVLTNKKIIAPSQFKTVAGARALRCSFGPNDGYLYPLDKSFFAIHKLPIHIPYSNISSIEFGRLGTTATNTRTFDIEVHSATPQSPSYTFTNIQRNEYQNLFDFLKEKNVKLVGSETEAPKALAEVPESEGESDSEEDQDYVAGEEEDVPEEYASDVSSEDDADADENEDEDGGEVGEASKKKKQHKEGKKDEKREKHKEGKKEKKEKKEHRHHHRHHRHHHHDKKDDKKGDKKGDKKSDKHEKRHEKGAAEHGHKRKHEGQGKAEEKEKETHEKMQRTQ